MPDDLPIIYFLDEEENQRQFLSTALRALFGTTHDVRPLPVLREMLDYLPFLDVGNVAAVFVDQQLDQTGEITSFTGVQLSEMLRKHFPDMPIYVVTGHAIEGELTSEKAGSTDAVVSKPALVIGDPRSLAFRQQFLRKIGQYEKALTARQRKFRELLTKRLQGALTPAEATELEQLEAERLLPTASAEARAEKQIKSETTELSELLKRVEDLLKPQ